MISEFFSSKIKISLLAAIVFLLPSGLKAADFEFMPDSVNLGVGSVFEVKVSVDPKGEILNAFSGEIVFPESLSVEKISYGDSVIDLWVEVPQENGNSISWSGLVPGGFSGVVDPFTGEVSSGIFKVIFEAGVGTTGSIVFTESKALKNDGMATKASIVLNTLPINIRANLPKSSLTDSSEEDVILPEPFVPKISSYENIFDGKYFLAFDTIDKGGGVKSFLVKEGGSEWVSAESPYLLLDQTLRSRIMVKAVDFAGNERIEHVRKGARGLPWFLVLLPLIALVYFFVSQKMKNFFIIILFTALVLPTHLFAASLVLSGEGSTRNLGETFTVSVRASSSEKINAATGTLVYDKNRLELKSISKSESDVSFWVAEPADVNGTVHFEGVILLKESSKESFDLFRLVFITKATGIANISWKDGSVLKDDGRATNILETFANAAVSVKRVVRVPIMSITKAPEISYDYGDDQGEPLAILEYPTRVDPNEQIIIRGVAAPNESIDLKFVVNRARSIGERLIRVLKNDFGEKSASVESDEEGNFTYSFSESLVAGAYNIWAENPEVVSEGGESRKSDPVTMNVKYPTFYKFWITTINSAVLLVPVLILASLVFVVFRMGKEKWRRLIGQGITNE